MWLPISKTCHRTQNQNPTVKEIQVIEAEDSTEAQIPGGSEVLRGSAAQRGGHIGSGRFRGSRHNPPASWSKTARR
jgi:hypothetical protein